MKYAHLGELFLDQKGKTTDFYIDGFIQYLHSLTLSLRLQGLRGFGISEDFTAQICLNTENKNNPVKLTTEDLAEILESRLFI